MKKANAIIAIALSLMLSLSSFAQVSRNKAISVKQPATQPLANTAAREMLIKNATILTASHGTIQNGSILIRDGKIAAVGTNVTSKDPNALVIDATGKYVTP